MEKVSQNTLKPRITTTPPTQTFTRNPFTNPFTKCLTDAFIQRDIQKWGKQWRDSWGDKNIYEVLNKVPTMRLEITGSDY